MSAVEERLVRDIADVTRGVVVTESELRDAWTAVDDRIGDAQRGERRRVTVIVAAAAAAVLLILGLVAYVGLDRSSKAAPPAHGRQSPAPSVDVETTFLAGETPTVDTLTGVWRLDDGGVLMRFAEPDLVFWDRSGRLFVDPGVQGRYQLDGKRVSITVDGGPDGCGGQQVTFHAAVMADERLNILHASEACSTIPDERWVMERLLPTSAGIGELVFSADTGWQPQPTEARLLGTWLAEGGGYLLELAQDHSYHVATGAGEQVDVGQWSLTGSRLALTSSADSARCDAGDRLVLGGLEHENPGTAAIRGTVRENTCGAPWTPKAWILIPYEEQ